jgi:hypothetical protein
MSSQAPGAPLLTSTTPHLERYAHRIIDILLKICEPLYHPKLAFTK